MEIPDFAPGPVVERRLPVGAGVSVAVRLRNPDGPAAPVLVVHGLSANARVWDGVGDELAALGHPVAAVDQRGHGRSDTPDDGYDVATATADLVAVLDGLGWRTPLLAAGHGWGGNVVIELAARHPGRLGAVALVEGGTTELSTRFADWPTCEAAMAPAALDGLPAASIERRLRLEHADWPETGIDGTLANLEIRPDGTVRPWLSPRRHLLLLRAFWDHHPSARYPEITLPVLIVAAGDPTTRAARFDVARREEVAAAAAGLATSAVRWIDGDHDLHAQHPAVVAGLLHDTADGRLLPGEGADRLGVALTPPPGTRSGPLRPAPARSAPRGPSPGPVG